MVVMVCTVHCVFCMELCTMIVIRFVFILVVLGVLLSLGCVCTHVAFFYEVRWSQSTVWALLLFIAVVGVAGYSLSCCWSTEPLKMVTCDRNVRRAIV
jgi:hypothetical protein